MEPRTAAAPARRDGPRSYRGSSGGPCRRARQVARGRSLFFARHPLRYAVGGGKKGADGLRVG